MMLLTKDHFRKENCKREKILDDLLYIFPNDDKDFHLSDLINEDSLEFKYIDINEADSIVFIQTADTLRFGYKLVTYLGENEAFCCAIKRNQKARILLLFLNGKVEICHANEDLKEFEEKTKKSLMDRISKNVLSSEKKLYDSVANQIHMSDNIKEVYIHNTDDNTDDNNDSFVYQKPRAKLQLFRVVDVASD